MKAGKKKTLRYVLLLLGNTVLLFGIYCYFVIRRNVNFLFWVYFVALFALLLWYVIENRGFALKNVSYCDLPAEWGEEKKRDFLRRRDLRASRSKLLLCFIVPICLSLCFDTLYLFYGEAFLSLWGGLLG
ncbi:MAG: hypothetical protein MJ078_04730 [Clostridia bacterium]|nr:hypothetical protein [Clostridia bacterium]